MSSILVLLICLVLVALSNATSSIDCSGTEIHELVVKYDVDSSGAINDTELLTMSLALGLPLVADEATGVVSKYGGNTGELTDAELCNYLNTMLTTDSTDSAAERTSGKTVHFEETFNPTPSKLKPTGKPHQEKRTLRNSK